MFLVDFSNPNCLPEGSLSVVGAVNMAADLLVALVGDDNATLEFIGDPDLTALSAGMGTYKTSSDGSTDRHRVDFSDETKAYITASEPDMVLTLWVRYDPDVAVSHQLFSFGDADTNPAPFRFGWDADGHPYYGPSEPLPVGIFTEDATGLAQIGMSRNEVFFNGRKLCNTTTDYRQHYDDFVANLDDGGGIGTFITYFFSGAVAADSMIFYRMMLENYTASGRTALDAVQADYTYVMENAGFVETA
ncbi:hypothetical protein [Pseudoruegeria sp. HB172150]|uniref:hypothetical protein n=1 Tax=Pseudoruegeria sp. HB172150 TaxID=2721164 RepID=UPI001555C700|nr:hypothetical protein [Pseudoruegeria sp. HB172150]